MSFDSSASLDTLKPADVDEILRALYQTYPGPR
jgi:ActR/RegA family two-component response regulator